MEEKETLQQQVSEDDLMAAISQMGYSEYTRLQDFVTLSQQLKAKQEANAKAYNTKLEAIDKSIKATIAQQAKIMGYDLVLTKGVVLYGGDDITETILKVVK